MQAAIYKYLLLGLLLIASLTTHAQTTDADFSVQSEGNSFVLYYEILTAARAGVKGTVRLVPELNEIPGNNNGNPNYSSAPKGTLKIPEMVTFGEDDYLVTEIGYRAFAYCSELSGSLIIGDSVTYIGVDAFRHCGFTSLIIGSSVEIIESCVFFNCTSFTGNLIIPNSVVFIGTIAFGSCGFNGTLSIGDFVKTIENHAFQGVDFIGDLTIPNSMTAINDGAFIGCGFTGKLTIPSSIKSIGPDAFRECVNLSYIRCLGAEPPAISSEETNPFLYIETTIPVVIPCNSKEDYEISSFWRLFRNYQENIMTPDTLLLVGLANDKRFGHVRMTQSPCNSDSIEFKAVHYKKSYYTRWPDGSVGNTYTIGKPKKDSVVIAVFGPGYYIHFDSNGADAGIMAPQLLLLGETLALHANRFTKKGHVFSGWAATYNARLADCADKEDFSLAPESTADTTLYAVWTYTIQFMPNGVVGEDIFQTLTYNADSSRLKKNSFERRGHEFKGWATNALATNAVFMDLEKVRNINTDKLDTLKLYAVWEAIKYKVTFNNNGGDSIMADQILSYGIEQNLSKNRFYKTGFVFSGWATKAQEEVIWADESRFIISQDTTLFAIWAKSNYQEYTITFDNNGGKGMMAKQIYTDAIAQELPLFANDFTRDGYRFDGWAFNDTATKIALADRDVFIATNDTILYAVWRANTYSIIFDANGSEGKMKNQDMTYDSEAALDSNLFTQIGYTFQGWSDHGATTIKFDDKEIVENLSAENQGEITLYALWKAQNKIITLYSNNGIKDSITQVFSYDKSQQLKPNPFMREKHNFIGWAYDKDSKGYQYRDQELYSTTKDTTLYAIWEVTAELMDITISIYPNPVEDYLYIRRCSKDTKHFIIQNIHGKVLVKQARGSDKIPCLDVRQLVAGTYIIQAITGNADSRQYARFIKAGS